MRGSVSPVRGVLSGVGLGLLALGVVATAVYVLRTGDRDSVVQKLAAVLTLALVIAPGLWRWGRLAGTKRLTSGDAAEQLAKQVGRLWQSEASARKLTTAMPVRWRCSLGSAADATRGSGTVRFDPLPGVEPVTAAHLDSGGGLEDLFGVYGGLRSGRLVIHGEPGSGKTGAAILLLLDALKHRNNRTVDERARVPVPVLVTAHGWDPAEPLADWLARQLVRDNEFLRAPQYGPGAARDLIEDGYVAVILDGLDEMPQERRSEALRALDTQATFRLVVLTRSEEMLAATSGAHLRGAAALELRPLKATQAVDYLTLCQAQSPQSWHNLVECLGRDAGSAVAQAVDTPLMLALARDIYRSGGQADELLDQGRFPTRETIEDHLLDQLLTTAYTPRPGTLGQPRYTADQARRWLGYLARRMNQDEDGKTRELAWWQIPRWEPVWPRALAIVLVLTSVAGLYVLIATLVGIAPRSAVVEGLLHWLGKALMFGLGLALVSAPARDNTTRIRNVLLAGLVIGLGAGAPPLVFALRHGLRFVPGVEVEYVLVGWLLVSLGLILVTDRGARFPRQPERRGWWDRTDLQGTLIAGLAAGLAVALIMGLIEGITRLVFGGPKWLANGLVRGLVAGLAFGVIVGLGRRSRQYLGLQSPDGTDVRTILMAMIIGFAMALEYDLAFAVTFVVVVGFGGRPPRQLGRRQWDTARRRTTFVVGLGTGLVAGVLVGRIVGHSMGLWFGAAAGFGFGLVLGLVFAILTALGLPSRQAADPVDPRSLWGRERQFGLLLGIGVGLAILLLQTSLLVLPQPYQTGLVEVLRIGLAEGLVIGLGSWLVSSATWTATLAYAQLRRRSGTPIRLLRFLDDAHDREILRTVGPVYQFRHARLQDRLAQLYEDTLPVQKLARSRAADPIPLGARGATGSHEAKQAWSRHRLNGTLAPNRRSGPGGGS